VAACCGTASYYLPVGAVAGRHDLSESALLRRLVELNLKSIQAAFEELPRRPPVDSRRRAGGSLDQIGSAYTMSKHAMEAFTDSFADEMKPLCVEVSVIEPGNYKSNIGRAAVERAQRDPRLADRSKFKEPDEVAAAAVLALSEPTPKRHYLITPDESEAAWTIRRQISRLVQLDEGRQYTFRRRTLKKMLDEALARSRPRTP
jgi:hypothetical protein